MIAVLTAVPAQAWPDGQSVDTYGLRDAVEIMAAMRRRIDADSGTADDQRRYRAAAATLERLGRDLGQREGWPAVSIDAVALRALVGESGTAFPPAAARAHSSRWLERLSALGSGHLLCRFLDAVIRTGSGLTISVEPVATGGMIGLPEPEPNADVGSAESHPAAAPEVADALAALHERLPLPFADEQGGAAEARRNQARALRAQIVGALRRGDVIPVGMAAPHDVIAEVLRELVDPALPAGQLRIVHSDSSEGAPFPIGAAAAPREALTWVAARRTIRLGLMSMRHMEADVTVAGYWFRNRLVSVSDRTLAETEAVCYRDTLAQLERLVHGDVGHIELLHTGFEPAVIGFYRAVLAFNRERSGEAQVLVTPRYLHGREVTGTPWVAPAGASEGLLVGASEVGR